MGSSFKRGHVQLVRATVSSSVRAVQEEAWADQIQHVSSRSCARRCELVNFGLDFAQFLARGGADRPVLIMSRHFLCAAVRILAQFLRTEAEDGLTWRG